MHYMDLDVHCSKKAFKHNHSLTHFLVMISTHPPGNEKPGLKIRSNQQHALQHEIF